MSGSQQGKRQTTTGTKRTRRRQNMSNRAAAMSHPLRAQILRLLVEHGVLSPAKLTALLIKGKPLTDKKRQQTLANVSYHVRQLAELDCAELVETRPVRGAVEHFYRATERHLIDRSEWEALDPEITEDLVSGNFELILEDCAGSLQARVLGSDGQFHITRSPLLFDSEGVQEAMELCERCRNGMADAQRRSAERLAKSGEAGIPVSSSLAFFKMPADSEKPEDPAS
jgi:DNA-binding transcriptional ArsR family regulator